MASRSRGTPIVLDGDGRALRELADPVGTNPTDHRARAGENFGVYDAVNLW
ncbi:MAG: hypothetical protein ACYCST_18600 [Acidimicrobiales bacterium]